jgi:hypothetical protein
MGADKAVSIVLEGRRYNGSYLIDGKSLNVSSAYGSKSLKLAKGEEAETVAKHLLAEIVEAWRKLSLSDR